MGSEQTTAWKKQAKSKLPVTVNQASLLLLNIERGTHANVTVNPTPSWPQQFVGWANQVVHE